MKSLFKSQTFRIVEFNVENLFIYLDLYNGEDLSRVTEREWQKLSSSTIPNKPIEHVKALARSIRAMKADVLMLCEVGGRESLANFSRYFLNDEYAAFILEGDSDRGIDLGYLVKKSLPYSYDIISHKHRPIDFVYPHERLSQETGFDHLRSARVVTHKFSRDVLELRIFEGDTPVVVLMLVHLKSQLDRSRIDPGGRDRRRAELEKLIQIYNEIRDELEQKVPVLMGGDFNGSAALPTPSAEFESIYRLTGLKDCLEVAGVPQDERFTHMQIQGKRISYNTQLDYLFVPPELFSRVNHDETWVFRFQNETGTTLLIPRNFNEKRALPSDHYPVILTLNPVETP